jgi:hypothetical protein
MVVATKGQELAEARIDLPLRRTAAAGPLVVAVLAAALAPVARADEPYAPFRADGGPLDIRLVAVRPDAGDKFYDPNGKEIRWTGGVLDITDEPWNDQYRRDFIFRFPDVKEPVLFDIWHGVHLCGTRQYLKRAGIRPMGVHDGGQFYKWSTTFPGNYQNGMIAGLVPRSVAVRQVDLVLRYFYGPPQDPICAFTGPFQLGRTVDADEHLPYQMTCEQTYRMSGTSTFRLVFSIDVLRDESVSVILYDKDGKRCHPSIISRGARPFASFHGPLEQIAKVTLGERAYERTFHNVVVEYPQLPGRDHAAYLDRAVEALDMQRLLTDRLAQYSIRTPSQAITVIDLVQGGELARRVLEVIMGGEPRIDLSRVDEPTRQKLHAAARKWAASWDLYMRFHGVELGLFGGWPEFFDQAVTLLQDDYWYLPYNEDVDRDIEQVVRLLQDRWQDRLTPDQRDNLVAYGEGRRPLPVLGPTAETAGKAIPVEPAKAGRQGQ